MSHVLLDQLAPNFSLSDYAGNRVSLLDFLGRMNVLLVLNRTFA